MTSTFVGTSTGLRRRFDQPDGRVELNGKSADLSRSAWAGRHCPDFADHRLDELVGSLDERLSWARTRLDLPAGRYETILPPTAVADLMIYAYWTASGRDAEEGRNVFAGDGAGGTRIGEQLSSLPLTLRSDPGAPGLECPPFEIAIQSYAGLQSVFDNGAPVEPATWIDRGTLTDLVRTRAWARQTGAAPRPFVGNLLLDGHGDTTLEQMVADTERGLLLTCLWYIREVDPQNLLLTGLTRDGVYLVEDGQVRGAVNNFRWNESPVDLLSRATEAGRTRADPVAGVERRLPPHRHAAAAHPGLQHVDRQQGLLTPVARRRPRACHLIRGAELIFIAPPAEVTSAPDAGRLSGARTNSKIAPRPGG